MAQSDRICEAIAVAHLRESGAFSQEALSGVPQGDLARVRGGEKGAVGAREGTKNRKNPKEHIVEEAGSTRRISPSPEEMRVGGERRVGNNEGRRTT